MDEELGDQQWEQIAPLLPQHQRRGRPRADDRRTIEGIPSASSGQVCGCSGPVAAKDLPARYGRAAGLLATAG
jgi:transposase